MKSYTHPSIATTFIQSKDGSSYIKYWSYLRPTLILEADYKKWSNSQQHRTIDLIKINQHSTLIKGDQAKIAMLKPINPSFWIALNLKSLIKNQIKFIKL